jgi:hypothetical protein
MTYYYFNKKVKINFKKMDTEIIEAIKNKNLIEIFYDNELQIIKPYYYGSSLGNEILIAEQIKLEEVYCKNYYLNKAVDLNVLLETFNDSRENNLNFNKQLDKIWASH